MSANEKNPGLKKYAIVTVGASASFKSLIEEVLSEAFIDRLVALGFTRLVVQFGPDLEFFKSAKPHREELSVTGLSYDKDLRRLFSLTAPAAERARGLIITHAGSGSILEALDFDTNVIAVPNPTLMGNHQSEIAEEMERQGFLIHGRLGSLTDLLNEETLSAPRNKWPPEPDPDSAYPGGLWEVINSLMPRRKLGGETGDGDDSETRADDSKAHTE
ncbi:glycosyltransferase family 1 protein [Hypoxylon sp. CI-4A]|nr:glycosyltransferase family 1 protein [Hypoxylon sp. CI-4A]